MSLKSRRPARSLERRVGFRTNPPGVLGRPRRHYPPLRHGHVWSPTLIETIRARNNDPEIGDGEFAVVQHDAIFEVWQNDDSLGARDTATAARKLARKLANAHDRRVWAKQRWKRLAAQGEFLSAETRRLEAFTDDEKRRSGEALTVPDGKFWRTHPHLKIIPIESRLLTDLGMLHPVVDDWCRNQPMTVQAHSVAFAVIKLGRDRVPVKTIVLTFETAQEAMFFHFRWGGANDI